jgi:hypothetical protein
LLHVRNRVKPSHNSASGEGEIAAHLKNRQEPAADV